MTLNDGLREEFEKLLSTPEIKKLCEGLDKKILLDSFNALLQVKGKLDFDSNTMDNARIALIQSIRTNLMK